jgi:hypothetical protein
MMPEDIFVDPGFVDFGFIDKGNRYPLQGAPFDADAVDVTFWLVSNASVIYETDNVGASFRGISP